MPQYKAIVFDCDGTVLNTADDLINSVNYILEKYGYPKKTGAEILRTLGHGLEFLLTHNLPQPMEKEKFQKIFAEFKEYYFSHCLIATKPYEGIMPLLAALKQKYKLALVSNKNKIALNQLNELYFTEYMEAVVGESDALAKKPAPDMVNQALHELGVLPSEALYVGDSEVDKATADNSNMDCMLVTWGFRSRQQVAELKATYTVDTPEAIEDILLK